MLYKETLLRMIVKHYVLAIYHDEQRTTCKFIFITALVQGFISAVARLKCNNRDCVCVRVYACVISRV